MNLYIDVTRFPADDELHSYLDVVSHSVYLGYVGFPTTIVYSVSKKASRIYFLCAASVLRRASMLHTPIDRVGMGRMFGSVCLFSAA